MTADQFQRITTSLAFGYETLALTRALERLGIHLIPITAIAVTHPILCGITVGVLAYHLHDYQRRNPQLL